MELGLDPAEQERPLTTAPLFDGDECEEILRLVLAIVNHYLIENKKKVLTRRGLYSRQILVKPTLHMGQTSNAPISTPTA